MVVSICVSVPVSGITNTAGRILAGFLADLKCVNALLLHNTALVGAGLLCFADVFCREFISICFFAALFGLCVGLSVTAFVVFHRRFDVMTFHLNTANVAT